jgi:hypothetical protein
MCLLGQIRPLALVDLASRLQKNGGELNDSEMLESMVVSGRHSYAILH